MSAQPTIELDDVWKKFRRGERHDSLRDLLPSLARRAIRGRGGNRPSREEQEFWALGGVSFSVGPGESCGIIGPNGAGKSTILKILSSIMRPDRGRAQVRGRLSSLIEIGAGFHPDLTGAENVYLNGAVLGMTRREIDARFGDIVEFAELGDFMDTPIKRYSSGMQARLGFSVAAHMDPEVLLVDEVLSVGDMAFQNRCLERMSRFLAGGTTVVLISHNLQAIARTCQRVIVLNQGRVVCDAPPREAIDHYLRAGQQRQAQATPDANRRAEIVNLRLTTADGDSPETVTPGTRLRLHVRWRFLTEANAVTFGFFLNRMADNLYVYGANATELGVSPLNVHPGQEIEVSFDFAAHLTRGGYHAALHAKDLSDQSYLHLCPSAAQFYVREQVSYDGVADIALRCRCGAAEPEGTVDRLEPPPPAERHSQPVAMPDEVTTG